MSERSVRGFGITRDPELRQTLAEAARSAGLEPLEWFDGGTGGAEAQFERRLGTGPALVFLDLDLDPDASLRLAARLAARAPAVQVVAIARNRSPEALLGALRAGVSEFLRKPLAPEALQEAVGRLRERLGGADAGGRGTRVVVFGVRGGVGATTIATNLAIRLRGVTDEPIALVDLDLELGEVAVFLGLQPRHDAVDLMESLDRLDDELLQSLVTRHASGVDVVPAPDRPIRCRSVGEEQVERMLDALAARYRFVVVDAGDSPTARATAAMRAADEVLLVAQADVPSLRNVQRLRAHLQEVGRAGPVRLIVNRFDPRGDIQMKDVERSVGMPVEWTVSSDYGAVSEAINAGRPIGSSAPARELDGLVRHLVGRDGPAGGRGLARAVGRFRSGRSGDGPRRAEVR